MLRNKLQLHDFEQSEFPRRLALVHDTHTIRGIPFRGVVSALSRICGDQKLAEVCSELRLGPRFDLTTRYPLRDFLRLEYAAATAIAEVNGDFDLAVAECGAGASNLFFDSRTGEVMRALAGRSPHRMLSSVPLAFQMLVNFGERTWTKTSANSGVFKFRGEVLGVMHTFGVFDASLMESYGDVIQYELVIEGPTDFDFVMSW